MSSVVASTSNGGSGSSSGSGFEWTPEIEVQFLSSFLGQEELGPIRPVGAEKHFAMMIALSRFSKILPDKPEVEVLWEKLESLYDMSSLEQINVPFPNEFQEFQLPFGNNKESKKQRKESESTTPAAGQPAAEGPKKRRRRI